MTTSRRADKGDGPIKESDLDRGLLEPTLVPDATGNRDQAGEQPRRPRVPAKRPAPAGKAILGQPGSYAGPLRDLLNFSRWAATDPQAQEGLDQLLRSFSRHILWPFCFLVLLLTVDVVLLETMPGAPLAAKI